MQGWSVETVADVPMNNWPREARVHWQMDLGQEEGAIESKLSSP